MCIGIDPGVNGGIALIWSTDPTRPQLFRMPDGETEIWKMLSDSVLPNFDLHGAIELVTGYVPARNKTKGGEDFKHEGQPGSSMFNFGHNRGACLMALIALGIDPDQVHPLRWTRFFGMRKDPQETKTRWKNRLRAKAQELYPRTKVTLNVADALLIARWCQVQHADVRTPVSEKRKAVVL
jgi:hypothetical protein